MEKLLPVSIFAIFMAVLSHRRSGYDPIDGVYRHKERLFYAALSVALIALVGLRTFYNDTTTYLVGYEQLREFPERYQSLDRLKLGDNPGFIFTQGILLRLNASNQTFLMVFSIFTVGTTLWFYHKYSCNLWLSILMFLSISGYTFHMAAIKQCTAMAFCLIATDRAINKKYITFVVYVLLGSLFHPYALMYLIVPFLFFRPWSKATLFMIAIFAAVGFGMESLIGTILNVTDMLGENYNATSFIGEGVNPFRLLVVSVPVLVAFFVKDQIGEKEEKEQYLIVNLAMLNAEIMFVALFGTANYFARLANYFMPFQALAIPWLLKFFDQRGRRSMMFLTVLGYSLYFIYSQAIHESFDSCYYGITLWDYLSELLEGVLYK